MAAPLSGQVWWAPWGAVEAMRKREGMPAGKWVHMWFKEVVATGNCSYIAHIKATRQRQQ